MKNLRKLWTCGKKLRFFIIQRPNAVDALHNLGVGYAKKARLVTSPEQENLYSRSFEIYKKALSLLEDSSETYEILFDWGNALYRQVRVFNTFDKVKAVAYQAKMKVDASVSPELFINTLTSSSEKYQQALQVKPKFSEALINWGISLELLCQEASRTNFSVLKLEKAVETYLSAFEKSSQSISHFLSS